MPAASHRWEEIHNQVSLCEVPRHFAGIAASPYLLEYLKEVLRLCPPGARACETGIGSGFGAIWLSLRGVAAEGIDLSPAIVEREVLSRLAGEHGCRVAYLAWFHDTPGSVPVGRRVALSGWRVTSGRAAWRRRCAGSSRTCWQEQRGTSRVQSLTTLTRLPCP